MKLDTTDKFRQLCTSQLATVEGFSPLWEFPSDLIHQSHHYVYCSLSHYKSCCNKHYIFYSTSLLTHYSLPASEGFPQAPLRCCPPLLPFRTPSFWHCLRRQWRQQHHCSSASPRQCNDLTAEPAQHPPPKWLPDVEPVAGTLSLPHTHTSALQQHHVIAVGGRSEQRVRERQKDKEPKQTT